MRNRISWHRSQKTVLYARPISRSDVVEQRRLNWLALGRIHDEYEEAVHSVRPLTRPVGESVPGNLPNAALAVARQVKDSKRLPREDEELLYANLHNLYHQDPEAPEKAPPQERIKAWKDAANRYRGIVKFAQGLLLDLSGPCPFPSRILDAIERLDTALEKADEKHPDLIPDSDE